ncbi:hypothetical protein, partial [Nioella sp. MMSF_3534]|uniref:hypothetical protein n=1 Tax=Nioella sp. MMSF_3534 TaxID=3046720 RepID=UPI00273D322A
QTCYRSFFRAVNHAARRKSMGPEPRAFAIDLKPVQRISVPAAVVLAAELHRWSLNLAGKTKLRPRKPSSWTPRVRGLLADLGAFDLLGVHLKKRTKDPHDEIVLLPLQSDEVRDGERMQLLQSWLKNMGVVFDTKKYVFGALDEAVMNCIDHGYIDLGGKPKFPYAGHRWWATSCFDPASDSLRFFVYDQGVGIPACLPTNEDFWPGVSVLLAKITGKKTQSNIIESAFEVGRTRTGLSERGKGLDKMREAIRSAGGGYIRVISGMGDVTLGPTETVRKIEHSAHIGGTLVEWSIPIDALKD